MQCWLQHCLHCVGFQLGPWQHVLLHLTLVVGHGRWHLGLTHGPWKLLLPPPPLPLLLVPGQGLGMRRKHRPWCRLRPRGTRSTVPLLCRGSTSLCHHAGLHLGLPGLAGCLAPDCASSVPIRLHTTKLPWRHRRSPCTTSTTMWSMHVAGRGPGSS